MDNPEHKSSEQAYAKPAAVYAARWLFVLLGIIWLVFGVFSLSKLNDGTAGTSDPTMLLVEVLMFINAAVLIWIAWGVGQGVRLYYYFGLIVLSVNIFLTLTDEFGVFDFIILILAGGLMFLLVITRTKYLLK